MLESAGEKLPRAQMLVRFGWKFVSDEPEGAVTLSTPPQFFLTIALFQHKNVLRGAHLLQDLRPNRDAHFSQVSLPQ